MNIKQTVGTRGVRGLCIVAAAVTVSLSLVACGGGSDAASAGGASGSAGSTDASDTTPRIAVFMGKESNRYMAASLDGIKEVAEKNGGTVTAFDGNFDPAVQQAQIQDALVSGQYNAFVVQSVNNTALIPALEQAIEQGIKVASTGYPLGPDIATNKAQIDGQVMSAVEPSDGVAQRIGAATVAACEGKDPCKVVYMSGDPKNSFEQLKYDNFEKVVSPHSNITIVTRASTDYLADPARQTMQDILQANPDIDVVASNGDQMADGAAQAGTAAGAHFLVIGQGASQIAYDGIKAGTWYASAMGLPKDEGVIAAEALVKALNGEQVSPNYSDPVIDAGYTDGLLTKEFIQQNPDFKPQWAG